MHFDDAKIDSKGSREMDADIAAITIQKMMKGFVDSRQKCPNEWEMKDWFLWEWNMKGVSNKVWFRI